MNILVIGNGFDLAHGLPTKYTDFLRWIEVLGDVLKLNNIREVSNVDWRDINSKIKELIINYYKSDDGFSKEEFNELRSNNLWLFYFLCIYRELKAQGKENWIDFESEISNVIKKIEENIEESLEDKMLYIRDKHFEYIFTSENSPFQKNDGYTIREVRDILYNDLNRLIRLFEIYLCYFVEKIAIKVRSSDIENCHAEFHEKGTLLSKVISFNYTHTYEKVYLSNYQVPFSKYVNFIHGEANKANTIESNNMVLGIDEYLEEDKDKKIEFIGFKKYFQRIYKGTGNTYKSWVEEIRKDDILYKEKYLMCKEELTKSFGLNWDYAEQSLMELEKEKIKHHIFFYGHSLDVTDKDVIRDLLLNDTVHTTIFYYTEYENDKRDLFSKIGNLVKIIGSDDLIKRTSENSIEFVPQHKMETVVNRY